MRGRVLAAGWPFAGLLALDAGRAETPDSVPIHGLIVGNNDQNGSLVLESDDTLGPLATSATTRFYGVDGYPVGRGDIRVGDEVEAVQEKIGAEWVTTKIRVLRLTPRTSLGSR